MIEISNVTKIFAADLPSALKKVNASLAPGQIIGIVGPDGAGKTTLIRLMAALLVPSSGEISIDSFNTRTNPEGIHAMSGDMPQRFGLYEDLTVQQNLDLYADLRGVTGDERKSAYEKLLRFTGLSLFTDRLARYLSGGMKQKLGLACALIKKPKLLLLDEPSVGVDPISRRELWRMVNDLLAEGITIVWSTVYLDEAERCNTILLLDNGGLLYHGPPQTMTQSMNNRVFKISHLGENRRKLLVQILRQKNVIDGVIQGDDIRVVFKKDEATKIDNFELIPTAPRFEDAFIDILGGGPGGDSELANRSPEVEKNIDITVEAHRLTKKFGNFKAVDDISFSVKRGEIFGLLGPNGAGKSTTFRMLCALLHPTSGNAHVNGIDVQKAPAEARSQIGYMAQKFSLYGNLSVMQNLTFFSGIYNLSGQKQKEAIDAMVEIFTFSHISTTSALTLPLGYKQRLSLACATMHHPKILFLDEPTSGVDPTMRREFWNHINGLVQKGVTVLVSTHFMDEAEYCDRIALIYRGKIIQLDTPDALKKPPNRKNSIIPHWKTLLLNIS